MLCCKLKKRQKKFGLSCILKKLKHFRRKFFCKQSLQYWDGKPNMF